MTRGIATGGELAHLPRETLALPAVAREGPVEPLALHPWLHLYRKVLDDSPVNAWQIPGPLGILVAVGKPEAQNERGELRWARHVFVS